MRTIRSPPLTGSVVITAPSIMLYITADSPIPNESATRTNVVLLRALNSMRAPNRTSFTIRCMVDSFRREAAPIRTDKRRRYDHGGSCDARPIAYSSARVVLTTLGAVLSPYAPTNSRTCTRRSGARTPLGARPGRSRVHVGLHDAGICGAPG